ncbi:hypothetical protein HK405_001912 [Cladochytrium tenue]|nr:hypothetical protein HK405_001912 [Cladochytrium tenue]
MLATSCLASRCLQPAVLSTAAAAVAASSARVLLLTSARNFRARALHVSAAATAAHDQCVVERLTGPDTGICVIGLNRPDARNALGRALVASLRAKLLELRFDDSTRVVILRSLVERVFCAGADLKERASMSPAEVDQFVHSLRSAFTEFQSLPIPTIAAIDGAALGGGLEIALAADLRVAGQGARLGLPETKLAIIPGAGGTQRLPRLIGASRAKELMFTGRVLDNTRAHDFGLVNEAVEGSAYDRAVEIAREVLGAGPIAIRMAKLAVDKGLEMDQLSV